LTACWADYNFVLVLFLLLDSRPGTTTRTSLRILRIYTFHLNPTGVLLQ
jgi:hypothetical protein